MEEDDSPPVAVPMDEISDEMLPELDTGAPVGVTVITGYLGAGKSTVSSSLTSCFLIVMCQTDSFYFYF
jgi:putative protein kinase ArgK-like GTPase of G3E family